MIELSPQEEDEWRAWDEEIQLHDAIRAAASRGDSEEFVRLAREAYARIDRCRVEITNGRMGLSQALDQRKMLDMRMRDNRRILECALAYREPVRHAGTERCSDALIRAHQSVEAPTPPKAHAQGRARP